MPISGPQRRRPSAADIFERYTADYEQAMRLSSELSSVTSRTSTSSSALNQLRTLEMQPAQDWVSSSGVMWDTDRFYAVENKDDKLARLRSDRDREIQGVEAFINTGRPYKNFCLGEKNNEYFYLHEAAGDSILFKMNKDCIMASEKRSAHIVELLKQLSAREKLELVLDDYHWVLASPINWVRYYTFKNLKNIDDSELVAGAKPRQLRDPEEVEPALCSNCGACNIPSCDDCSRCEVCDPETVDPPEPEYPDEPEDEDYDDDDY